MRRGTIVALDLSSDLWSGQAREQAIYRNLVGVGLAADIVVVTTQDLERYKDNRYTVIRPALEEGQVVYAA